MVGFRIIIKRKRKYAKDEIPVVRSMSGRIMGKEVVIEEMIDNLAKNRGKGGKPESVKRSSVRAHERDLCDVGCLTEGMSEETFRWKKSNIRGVRVLKYNEI